MPGGEWDHVGGESGEVVSRDCDSCVEDIKEVEHEDVGEPTKEAEGEEVDGE